MRKSAPIAFLDRDVKPGKPFLVLSIDSVDDQEGMLPTVSLRNLQALPVVAKKDCDWVSLQS